MRRTAAASAIVQVCDTSSERYSTHRQMFFINNYDPSARHVRAGDTRARSSSAADVIRG